MSGPERPLSSLPRPGAAGPQDLWDVGPDEQTLTSRWFLALDGAPVMLSLTAELDGGNASGTVSDDEGNVDVIDAVTWEAETGVLDFRRRMAAGVAQWVHARAIEGVVTGRVGYGVLGAGPPADVAAYAAHVVGWNERYFSRDIVPRVFDLAIAGQSARLRLDRDGSGAIVGRFKVYADDSTGVASEQLEADVDVQAWDGSQLRFVRSTPSSTQSFEATVDGRTLIGTVRADAEAPVPFDGVRAELLAYGFAARDGATRNDWQQRARRQLAHLMMADNPAPLSLSVDRQPADVIADDGGFAPDRDDDAADWPASYTVDELQLSATLPNPYAAAPLSRAMHGYLTTPPGDVPAGGWPAMIVLNGHEGSALGTLDPSELVYWYGDAWARRNWVVLALDVGHRPVADRAALYRDYADGDRPDDGNGLHPAIAAVGLDSDWVEDGERTWDVERAVDYLAGLANVDSTRIAVTGLSMGGEVASFAGALDPRIAAVVPAGFVPDLTVMAGHGNHPCWEWLFGDPLDYYSVSDLHALVAPRPLVVEAGMIDDTFSDFAPPFVDAKEVVRRSRAAFAGAPAPLALYLHPDGHAYRFGDLPSDGSDPLYVTVPAVDAPRTPDDLSWAADGSTINLGRTLPGLLAR